MSTGTRLAGLLLLTTSLTLPSVLHAQEAPQDETEVEAETTDPLADPVEGETPPEASAPAAPSAACSNC